MTPTEAAAVQDAELARTDAELVSAGITELKDLLEAGRLDSLSVTEVVRDLLPKIAALKAWLEEQVVEVTA